MIRAMNRIKHPTDPKTVAVIDHLGGTSAVARLCELDPSTVSEWKRVGKGIPKSWRKYLKTVNPTAFRRGHDAAPGKH